MKRTLFSFIASCLTLKAHLRTSQSLRSDLRQVRHILFAQKAFEKNITKVHPHAFAIPRSIADLRLLAKHYGVHRVTLHLQDPSPYAQFILPCGRHFRLTFFTYKGRLNPQVHHIGWLESTNSILLDHPEMPSQVDASGAWQWFQNGIPSCPDGHASSFSTTGFTSSYRWQDNEGYLHHTTQPACIFLDTSFIWYFHDLMHRPDQVTQYYSDGRHCYLEHEIITRRDGPAACNVEFNPPHRRKPIKTYTWYWEGVPCMPHEHPAFLARIEQILLTFSTLRLRRSPSRESPARSSMKRL